MAAPYRPKTAHPSSGAVKKRVAAPANTSERLDALLTELTTATQRRESELRSLREAIAALKASKNAQARPGDADDDTTEEEQPLHVACKRCGVVRSLGSYERCYYKTKKGRTKTSARKVCRHCRYTEKKRRHRSQ